MSSAVAILVFSSLVAHPPAPARHCQIPCGIYSDMVRVDLLLEDVATITKGMKQIDELSSGGDVNYNQLVRWISNKDEHAGRIQSMVADYWLAQRIKPPKDAGDEKARNRYLYQLELLHHINVHAMKCKQTTDVANAEKIRTLTSALAKSYFSEEDLKHLKEHHGKHHQK